MVGAYTALAEALVPVTIGLGEVQLPPEPPAIEGALNRALTTHPRAEIHTFVARRAIEDWDFEKAEAAARRAVEANPNNAQGWLVRGYVLQTKRQRDEARAAYEKCIEVGGTTSSARECRVALRAVR